MRLLSNLHVKGKPAVLPDRAIRRQSHYFILSPRIFSLSNFTLTIQYVACYPASFCHSQISYILRSKDMTQKTIHYAILVI
jgi:hypothetical protein